MATCAARARPRHRGGAGPAIHDLLEGTDLTMAPDDVEPTAEDLAAIEDEEPLIKAEMDLLAVQIKIATSRKPVDEVTVRRLYRAQDAVVAETLRWYAHRFNATHRAA